MKNTILTGSFVALGRNIAEATKVADRVIGELLEEGNYDVGVQITDRGVAYTEYKYSDNRLWQVQWEAAEALEEDGQSNEGPIDLEGRSIVLDPFEDLDIPETTGIL